MLGARKKPNKELCEQEQELGETKNKKGVIW
jgi:hypothetical protein